MVLSVHLTKVADCVRVVHIISVQKYDEEIVFI
jgi:hypothetical protein